MTPREHVIDVVNRLVAAREQLRRLEAELEELLGAATAETVRKQPPPPQGSRGGVSTRVLDLLASEPDAAFTVPQIAGRLKLANVNALRQAVVRLASRERIERRSRGAYGAVGKGRSGRASGGAAKQESWLNRLFE